MKTRVCLVYFFHDCSSAQIISRCTERKRGCLLYYMRIRRKRCSAADGMLKTPTLSFYIVMVTISYLFVCLPTLELTKFEQQVCSTKIGYANHWGQTTGKK